MKNNSLFQEKEYKPKKIYTVLWSILNPAFGFLYLGKAKKAIYFFSLMLMLSFLAYFFKMDIFSILNFVLYVLGIIFCLIEMKKLQSIHWNRLHIWLKGFSLFILVWISIRIFFFDFFSLPIASMSPNYSHGTYAVMKKWGMGSLNSLFNKKYDINQLKRGDVIVFEYPHDPSMTYIKRVIALPGDRISFDHGNVVLNGTHLNLIEVQDSKRFNKGNVYQHFVENNDQNQYEIIRTIAYREPDYLFMQSCAKNTKLEEECMVPSDAVFVLGDHRDQSADSRYWGFVPSENIKGTVIASF